MYRNIENMTQLLCLKLYQSRLAYKKNLLYQALKLAQAKFEITEN